MTVLHYSHLRQSVQLAVLAIGVLLLFSSCSRPVQQAARTPGEPVQIAELWQAPDDLQSRDLLLGPGGADLRPQDKSFQFVSVNTGGASLGYEVRDARGLVWSVKVGKEAQSEVAVSRILWAIGYHQPPTYYLTDWTFSGAPATAKAEPARFRPELADAKVVGDWSWYENPFVGSQPFGGLLTANLILTAWDWKTSNNKVYEFSQPRNDLRRWYVVRDLGASLGKFTYPKALEWTRLRGFGQGTKNDLEGFEQQPFLVSDPGGFKVDYRGIYGDLVKTISPKDVRWTCELLSRLSDQQLGDAFRAAGYTPEETSRYVKKLKEKIAQGLALSANSASQ